MKPKILDDLENRLDPSASRKTIHHIIHGLIQMVFSVYSIWDNVELWIRYKSPDLLIAVMYPTWILVLYAVLGLAGFLVGLAVYFGKLSPKQGYLRLLYFLCIGMAIDFFGFQF